MTKPWAPAIEAWVGNLTHRVSSVAKEAAAKNEQCDLYLVGHSVGCQTIVRFLATPCATALLCGKWIRLQGCLCVAAWLSAPSPAVIDPWDTIEPWCTSPIDCAAAHRLLTCCHGRRDLAERHHKPLLRVLLSDNDRYTPDFEANSKAWYTRLGGSRSSKDADQPPANASQLVDVQVVEGRAHFGSKKQLEVLAAAQTMLRRAGAGPCAKNEAAGRSESHCNGSRSRIGNSSTGGTGDEKLCPVNPNRGQMESRIEPGSELETALAYYHMV
jgi:hypothetical protein